MPGVIYLNTRNVVVREGGLRFHVLVFTSLRFLVLCAFFWHQVQEVFPMRNLASGNRDDSAYPLPVRDENRGDIWVTGLRNLFFVKGHEFLSGRYAVSALNE